MQPVRGSLGVAPSIPAFHRLRAIEAPVDEPQCRQHWIEDVPMQRYTRPEEIALRGLPRQ